MSSCSTPPTAAGSLRATSGRSPCRSTSPSSSSALIRTSWNSARPTAERRHAARQRSTLDPLPCTLQKDIVKVEEELYPQDYAYRTRHARVAQLVFRQACQDDETKARQFKRILEGLDPGYSADSRALDEITRGRVLLKTFNGVAEARELYEMAVRIAPKQGY